MSSAEMRSTEGPFAGLPVGDFPGTEPGPGVAVRLHIDWSNEDVVFGDLLSKVAAHPGAAELEALVIGSWEADSLFDSNDVIDGLVGAAARFPKLRALFFGDASQEVSEISWIECGDQAKLANAFPGLEHLHIRGNGGPSLAGLNLPRLHTLVLETGGLNPDVVRTVLATPLPALRHLELWLGTPNYGGDTSVADLAPLLDGSVHTGLTYLGLRNAEIADEVAFAVSRSAVLGWIEELDVSLGTLGDEGYIALSQMGPAPKLRRLDVSHHYAGPGAVDALTTEMARRGVAVDTSNRQEDDEDRWVSISE